MEGESLRLPFLFFLLFPNGGAPYLMKITVSRLFDTQKIIDAFTAAKVQGIEDFVSNLSDLSDQIVRIFRSRVSLSDNIDCTVRDLTVQHNVTLTVANPKDKSRVKQIVVGRSSDFDNPSIAMAWAYNANDEINIKAQLLLAGKTQTTLTITMYY